LIPAEGGGCVSMLAGGMRCTSNRPQKRVVYPRYSAVCKCCSGFICTARRAFSFLPAIGPANPSTSIRGTMIPYGSYSIRRCPEGLSYPSPQPQRDRIWPCSHLHMYLYVCAPLGCAKTAEPDPKNPPGQRGPVPKASCPHMMPWNIPI